MRRDLSRASTSRRSRTRRSSALDPMMNSTMEGVRYVARKLHPMVRLDPRKCSSLDKDSNMRDRWLSRRKETSQLRIGFPVRSRISSPVAEAHRRGLLGGAAYRGTPLKVPRTPPRFPLASASSPPKPGSRITQRPLRFNTTFVYPRFICTGIPVFSNKLQLPASHTWSRLYPTRTFFRRPASFSLLRRRHGVCLVSQLPHPNVD